MTSPLTTFACDRSQRWILVPGVASTRQIEIRNETDSPIEVHVHVEEPSAASASPAVDDHPAASFAESRISFFSRTGRRRRIAVRPFPCETGKATNSLPSRRRLSPQTARIAAFHSSSKMMCWSTTRSLR